MAYFKWKNQNSGGCTRFLNKNVDIDLLKIYKKTLKLNTLSDMLVVLYGKQSKKRKKISKKGQSITKITFYAITIIWILSNYLKI